MKLALLRDGVTILNFDDSYLPQKHLRQYSHEWVDLQDIPHTNRYCETASLLQIQQRLQRRRRQGITLIGSGNYHYVSYLLLSEIKQPFTLILFDHHTDMLSAPSPSLISCGSWVADALARLALLQQVIVIGARPDLWSSIPAQHRSKVVVFGRDASQSAGSKLASLVLQTIVTDGVYISIDKDVLDPSQAVTDWDQGSLQLADLLGMLRTILVHKTVLGADICGELPASPFQLLQPNCLTAIEKNERANRKILGTLLNAFRRHDRRVS